MAKKIGVKIKTFQADVIDYRLKDNYDVLFSTGVLHYIPKIKRENIFNNYKEHTNENGINIFSVFVKKPFINSS